MCIWPYFSHLHKTCTYTVDYSVLRSTFFVPQVIPRNTWRRTAVDHSVFAILWSISSNTLVIPQYSPKWVLRIMQPLKVSRIKYIGVLIWLLHHSTVHFASRFQWFDMASWRHDVAFLLMSTPPVVHPWHVIIWLLHHSAAHFAS